MQLGVKPKGFDMEKQASIEPIDVFDIIKPKVIEKQTKGDVSVKQFYRRALPDTCISFCSTEGQEIFKEALASGHMQCYFKLAAQFRTQDEPAYCGLSTLVMVLNSLEVDPGNRLYPFMPFLYYFITLVMMNYTAYKKVSYFSCS